MAMFTLTMGQLSEIALSASNATNGCFSGSRHCGDFAPTQVRVGADNRDRLWRQTRTRVVRTPKVATLLDHIAHVVGAGSEEEMIRIDAKSHVAFVADVKPRRYGANEHHPSRAMRSNGFVSERLSGSKRAVSRGPFPRRPEPTAIRINTNLRHESLKRRCDFTGMISSSHCASPKAPWSGVGCLLLTDGPRCYMAG
jgi:hypothetical protein